MSEMEIVEDSEDRTECFKCKEQLFGSLNIIQKDFEKNFLLWNKYQIFLYEDLNFETVSKVFSLDFQVNQVIVSNNYLVCVDCNGNVHTTSLKLKDAGQKRLKSSFQPRAQGILHCMQYSPEFVLSIKLQSDSYFLCLHKISAEFPIEREITLTTDEKPLALHSSEGKPFILSTYAISKQEFRNLSQIFKEDCWKNHSFVLMSFDKHTIYACLFSSNRPDSEICLKKLYASPAEICDMKIIGNGGLEVLIGLSCGTLVRLNMNNYQQTPEIIHLNTALSKFIPLNSDSIIYSDGMTMWKADNLSSKENINYEQFLIKDVKDFVKYNGQLICTTFTNLIYKFSIENETSYIKKDKNTYCSVEKLQKNSDYLYRIYQEIERNKEVIKNINDEENNLTIVSLSKRQDVMAKFIQENVIVYESYKEINANSEVKLTEELQNYFKPELILILVEIITSTIQHNLSNILTNILGNLKIHITLSTEGKVLKTTTVKVTEPLKKLQLLIPLVKQNISQMNVELQIVSEIPGALDKNETNWSVLYRKNISLNAEHFIKTIPKASNRSLKEPKNNIEEMICKSAENHHGDLFKFTDNSQSFDHKNHPSFYVKLPLNYAEMLKDDKVFSNQFNHQKARYIQNHTTSEDFLKSKCNVLFEIGSEKVCLEVIKDDFSSNLLKVSCKNIKIAAQIRNFFAKVFHGDFKKYTEEEFVSNVLYTTTENLQKELKKCSSSEDCLLLAERLQKNVIAALPL